MKGKTVYFAGFAAFIILVRIVFPNAALALQELILPRQEQTADYGSFIYALGQKLSGEYEPVYVWENESENEEITTQALIPPDVSEAFPLEKMVSQNLISYNAGAHASHVPVIATGCSSGGSALPPLPEVSPEPAVEPSLQEQKLAAYMEAQAAFSEYAVPANVSYEIPSLPFEYASPGTDTVCTGSGFGFRLHPIYGDVRFHYGTDMDLLDGDPIKAFAAGTVASVAEYSGYGLTVMLDHGNGYVTLYAHCSKILVTAGDYVNLGDTIAITGHSGKVTGPHLHFEIRHDGTFLNPEFYL